MKWLGITIPFVPDAKTRLWSKSALDDPRRVEGQLAALKVAANDVAMNSVSLADTAPELGDLRGMARMILDGRAGSAQQRAELALVAAVGPTIAKAMLSRREVRERWDALVRLAQAPAQTTEISRGDALRLSRELQSPAAQALRAGVGVTTLYADLMAEHAPHLSPRAVELCLRSAVSRDNAAHALKVFNLQHELRAVLGSAGAQTIGQMSVRQLLTDQGTVFDAFQRFVEANDRALGVLATMTDAMNAALRGEGRADSFDALIAQLRLDVAHMLEWHEALYDNADTRTLGATATTLLDQVSAIAHEVDAILATRPAANGSATMLADAPAYVKTPCSRLLEVCSKSKPEVEVGTIATVEELIRVMHREATAGYARVIDTAIARGLSSRHGYSEELKSRTGSFAQAKLVIRTAYPEGEFEKSAMGKVYQTFKQYIETAVHGDLHISSAVLTDQSFSFDTRLGAHVGRLLVAYEPATKTYALEWGLQEPGLGGTRISFCKEYFKLAGFSHSRSGWKHTARRTVSAEELPKILTFLLFSLENVKNVDIYTPYYDPPGLKKVFDSWYGFYAPSPVDLTGVSALEDRVTKLAEADPHVFRMAITDATRSGGSDNTKLVDAARTFVVAKADMLFDGEVDKAKVATAIATTARVGERVWKKFVDGKWVAPQPMSDSTLRDLAESRAAYVKLEHGKVAFAARSNTAFSGPIYQDTVG